MAPHTTPTPKPVEKFTCSSITANVWQHDGEKGPFYHVTITRAYKGSDGTWKHSDSFSLNDLDAVTVVLGHAKVWIMERSGR